MHSLFIVAFTCSELLAENSGILCSLTQSSESLTGDSEGDKNGQEVAIKIQYPEIAKTIEYELTLAGLVPMMDQTK
jgi:hypothetical protein